MKDGIYDIGLHSSDIAIRGTLALQDDTTSIHGPVNVTIEALSSSLVKARLDVRLGPTASGRSHLPRHFSLVATGEATHTDFSLVGIGPFGLAIHLTGSWVAPLDRDAS